MLFNSNINRFKTIKNMQTHYILTGTQQEIDSSITLSEIVNLSTGISIFNYSSLKQKPADVFKTNTIGKNVDIVLVYTNNLQIDFCEFLDFAKKNAVIVKQNITFVFMCRHTPFVVNTYVSKHFRVINAIKNDGELQAKPNLTMLRLHSKIKLFTQTIDELETDTNYSTEEKRLFQNYFRKKILDLETQKHNLSNVVASQILRQINVII